MLKQCHLLEGKLLCGAIFSGKCHSFLLMRMPGAIYTIQFKQELDNTKN